jgi:hypothetical protein
MRKTSPPNEVAVVMQAAYVDVAAFASAGENAHLPCLGAGPLQQVY